MVSIYYTIRTPFPTVEAAARKELGETSRQFLVCYTPDMPILHASTYWETEGSTLILVDRRSMDNWYGGFRSTLPKLPENTTGIIRINKRLTPLDRFRAWLFGLRVSSVKP